MSDQPALTPSERDEYDYWLQQIPSGGTEEALWNLMRLQITHDTATVRTIAAGWPELLDAADERMRELVDAARELRTATDTVTLQVDAAVRIMGDIRRDLDAHIVELRAADDVGRVERERIARDLSAHARAVAWRMWALAGAVALLSLDLLYRYVWPLVAAALLSVVLGVWL